MMLFILVLVVPFICKEAIGLKRTLGRVNKSDRERLYDDLLSEYTREVLPMTNRTGVVRITFKLAVINVDVDESTKILSSILWYHYWWRDYRLSWDPKAYGGVGKLRLPADDIWLPDIKLYNSLEAREETDLRVTATVYANGTVYYRQRALTHTRCTADNIGGSWQVQYECPYNLGSWAYDAYELDFEFYHGLELDMTSFDQPHTHWYVMQHNMQYLDTFHPCCSEPYATLLASLTLKRGR